MTKLSELLSALKTPLPLAGFTPRVVKAVEDALTEKNGKPYIMCANRPSP